MEIERKYLVVALPEDIEQYPHTEIEQGYLCTSPTVRIRKAGDVFWLTVKEHLTTSSTAIHNREEEFKLSKTAYECLKSKCEGHLVIKTRYCIPVGNLIAELDIFHGIHSGLILVEVEFPDTNAADNFKKPSWFGEDVSQKPQYKNSFLALSVD